MASNGAASLLSSGLTHPLILDVWLTRNVSSNYQDDDSEVVFALAIKAAGAANISEVNRSKIEALKTVRRSTLPYTNWPAFEKVTMAFNGVVPIIDICQKPNLGQLLVVVDVLRAIHSLTFSDEVVNYMAAALLTDDVVWAPEPLTFCNPVLGKHSVYSQVVQNAFQEGRSTDPYVQDRINDILSGQSYAREFAERFTAQAPIVGI